MHVKNPGGIIGYHWDGRLPVNEISIAKSMGISIFPDLKMSESSKIEVVDGVVKITYNANDSLMRRRFAIAHEIGHFVLGHLNEKTKEFKDPHGNFSPAIECPLERDANEFAISLLMPAQTFEFAINQKKILDIDQLAKVFQVSQVAIKHRMMGLGILNQLTRSKPAP